MKNSNSETAFLFFYTLISSDVKILHKKYSELPFCFVNMSE